MRRSVILLSVLATILLAPSFAAGAADDPFLEAGIPAPARVWSGPDYERTSQILVAGKVPLPRFADPRGAALLERLTSTDNLSLQRDKSLPLAARLQDFLQVQQGAGELLKLYLNALAKGDDCKSELVHLAAFVLHSSAQGGELVEEMLPTLPRDETYAKRMEGLKQMNQGLTTVFVGAEQMLSEQNGFAAADLSVLLEAMARTLPQIKKGFPPDFHIELRKKLEADKARFKGAEDTRRLDTMIRELGPA